MVVHIHTYRHTSMKTYTLTQDIHMVVDVFYAWLLMTHTSIALRTAILSYNVIEKIVLTSSN